MRVQDAHRILSHRVHRAVNGETRRIDAEAFGVVDDASVEVDCDQVGRGHLFEAQAVRVDQEAVMPAGEADRDVGIDRVVETEPVDQPVGGGKIDPDLTCVVFQGTRRDVRCHHSRDPGSTGASLLQRRSKSKTKLSTIDA